MQTKTPRKFFIFTILCVSISLLMEFLRNEWYLIFYNALQSKSGISINIIQFLGISLVIELNNATAEVVKTYFIAMQRTYMPLHQFVQLDAAQKICEDTQLQAKHYINFIYLLIHGSAKTLFFSMKMIFLLRYQSAPVLLILFIYASLMGQFYSGKFKQITQKMFHVYSQKEATLRRNLATWLSKKCIAPINFNYDLIHEAIAQMKKFHLTKIIIRHFVKFYESVGAALPFVVFYSIYINNSISYGQLMQYINLWTLILYGIIETVKSIEHYNEYEVSKRRLTSCFKTVTTSKGDNLELKNVKVFAGNKIIIKNISFKLKKNEKINIVGKNKAGKTSLMQAMQGFKQFEGEIIVPKNILWICEHPILPDKTNFEQTQQFIENAKIMQINPTLRYAHASGSEKWRLIAAYAMCFEYVVWDDPFWGLHAEQELPMLLKHLKSAIIFSAKKIEGMKHILVD